jgi:hypothetical protein
LPLIDKSELVFAIMDYELEELPPSEKPSMVQYITAAGEIGFFDRMNNKTPPIIQPYTILQPPDKPGQRQIVRVQLANYGLDQPEYHLRAEAFVGPDGAPYVFWLTHDRTDPHVSPRPKPSEAAVIERAFRAGGVEPFLLRAHRAAV